MVSPLGCIFSALLHRCGSPGKLIDHFRGDLADPHTKSRCMNCNVPSILSPATAVSDPEARFSFNMKNIYITLLKGCFKNLNGTTYHDSLKGYENIALKTGD